jgi:hypothetical protein
MRDHARQIVDPAENSLRVGAARGRQVALEISDSALCGRSRRRWTRHETRPRPMRDRGRRRSPCRKAVSRPFRGHASLTSRQLRTPRSGLCDALQAGRPATKAAGEKSPLALLAISATPTDGLDDTCLYACEHSSRRRRRGCVRPIWAAGRSGANAEVIAGAAPTPATALTGDLLRSYGGHVVANADSPPLRTAHRTRPGIAAPAT